ncbi:MAG: hypothetical protein J6B06_03115 [Lachnospiraceae bacterium]|nr:hypothetical protein [Lachnospiraceae bacterium]
MNKGKDIGKILLYGVLTVLLLLLAKNSIELAASARYIIRPYNMIPQQLYELEYSIEDGNFQSLIKGAERNAVLEEQPLSDTTQQEALAGYIIAAFDYRAALENDRLQEAAEYYAHMQEKLEKIDSYHLLKVVDEVNRVYEIE